jgi:trehalose 6-phosphate synthase
MSRAVRFAIGLIAGLGLLTWAALVIVQRTTSAWFEKDVRLRTELAVGGARYALISRWGETDRRGLNEVLSEIARDERIMAAAACGSDLSLLASTPAFPESFACARIGPRVRPAAESPASSWETWATRMSLPGGPVNVSAIPILDGDRPLGFVVLVQDLSYVARREAQTRSYLFVAFAVLAAAASLLTVVAARLSWRDWSDEIRRFLRGGPERPGFQPILGDVRQLVDRIMLEHEADGSGANWTPDRLKQTLNRYLHREKVVIVANREPYIHERRPDGGVAVIHPASGLVTALEPLMRACSGVWVAHGGGSADRETADRHGRVKVPPGEDAYVLRRVWLSSEEERGYYYGFANEGLWPLCHVAHARPVFRATDWEHYREVNRKFADAVCHEVEGEDSIVLVQDYHFTLLPRLIHDRLPRATVIMFLHTPWPNSESFGICPWRQELLEGMLGASILGFHTQHHCNNFLDTVDRFLEARIDRAESAVVHRGRRTLVRAYPISLEWPVRWLRDLPSPAECRKAIFAELGLAPDALLGVGVDRLDYTKGIEERFLAVERLLERHPEFRGRFTFAQLAAPSRTLIERYQQLNQNVEALAARINASFGEGAYRPIALLRAHHEPPAVFRYYRAADVCYVSSLHDGMNLVAKEFGAAREDEKGVLVLSEFTGAARELTEALIVNPYDLEEASAALATALRMPLDAQRDRMRSMRAYLAEFNVYRWAGRMLVDAARLRRQERLAGRLQDGLLDSTAALR